MCELLFARRAMLEGREEEEEKEEGNPRKRESVQRLKAAAPAAAGKQGTPNELTAGSDLFTFSEAKGPMILKEK